MFHVHAPYSTSQGCLNDSRILPVHQDSLRFIDRSEHYKEYDIPALASEEGINIGKAIKDKDALFMENHGKLYHLWHSKFLSVEVFCVSLPNELNLYKT